MASLSIFEDLLIVPITLRAKDQEIVLPRMAIDTGSASTLLKSDDLRKINIEPPDDAMLRKIRGIGGFEQVLEFPIPYIAIDNVSLTNFTIQAGAVNYGFPMDGLLGLNFLRAVHANIDLSYLRLKAYDEKPLPF